jgi:hypothetical protein
VNVVVGTGCDGTGCDGTGCDGTGCDVSSVQGVMLVWYRV